MHKFISSTSYWLTVCLLVFCPALTMAEMYKWVDKDGNTHYTQTPPAGGTESRTIKPPSRVNTDAAAKAWATKKRKADRLRENRINAQKEKAAAAEEVAEKNRRCESARLRVATYQRPRVNIVDEQGNRTRATEEYRQAELKKARAYLNEHCK